MKRTALLGMEMLLDFFGGGESNTTVGLQLIAGKMKICSYLPVG